MKLGKELWKKIEAHQGYAFVPDSIEECSDESVMAMAEFHLLHSKKATAVLQAFVKKHRKNFVRIKSKKIPKT